MPGSDARRLLKRVFLTLVLAAVTLVVSDFVVGMVMHDALRQTPYLLPLIANSEGADFFRLATNEGKKVIVFTGSSTTWLGVSPHIFDTRVQALTNQSIYSLNVSVATANVVNSRDLIKTFILPKGVETLIYGVEIRALNSIWLDKPFEESPLGYTSELEPGLEKSLLVWLLDHSNIARYRRNFYELMYGNPMDFTTQYSDDRGFLDQGPTIWNIQTSDLDPEFLSLSSVHPGTAFGDIANACKDSKTRCVFVYYPVHPLLSSNIPPAVKGQFLEILHTQVIDRGLTVWDLSTPACQAHFPKDLFHDQMHMNTSGARQLSTMLADLYASQVLGQKLAADMPATCAAIYPGQNLS